MFSIKGIFKDNRLHLMEPLNIQKRTRVILTVMSESSGGPNGSEEDEGSIEESSFLVEEEEFTEEYYESLRKHKRFKAKGDICLIEGDDEYIYPLNDYSAGGLSFISDRIFEKGVNLTASIRDPFDQDSFVLDFEFEVARVISYDNKFKVGCRFVDDVDEELWHSLIGSNVNTVDNKMDFDF